MKTRRQKNAVDEPTPEAEPVKNTHGGPRPGSGRPKKVGGGMKQGIYLRCSEEQKDALTAYVEDLSARRAAEGKPKVDLSTWIRELALKASGNEQLGAAAQARAAADAAESIV